MAMMGATAVSQQDEVADKRTPEDIAKHWQIQIEIAEKDHKDWIECGKKVVRRYKQGKDKGIDRRGKRLNILYSNTEHLRAALYGKSAKPDVRRRFSSTDPIGQTAAETIEKALVYCAETYDVDAPIIQAIQDYLLPGRGVVRVEYEPIVSDGFVVDQELKLCYVYWEDFLCMPGRTWADIVDDGWVSFRHTMTREKLRQNFPAVADDVPLNWMPDITDRKDVPDTLKRAEVFEIWDASDRKRYWIVKGFGKPLRIDDDPYGLEDFFPTPEPITAYTTTDTIVPEPEFHIYQDQADDLDEITARISRLTAALKRRGVYDASVKELERLANAGDNVFLPVENYAALATKGGLANAFQSEDVSIIANVLVQLYQQRDMLVQAIYELTGIADIQRGSSDPDETLGAQQLKAQFGSQRLKRRQRRVQQWIRDLLKLKAEIIAEHFEPQVIMEMTGEQIDPQVFQVLRTDKLRSYRIDIETDSTVFEDAEIEKRSRVELVATLGQYIQQMGPIVQQSPEMGALAFELMKFGLGAFKGARTIDDAIDQMAVQFEQRAQMQPQQGSPPDPRVAVEMQRLELDKQRMAAELELEQQKLDHEKAASVQKAEFEREKLDREVSADMQRHRMSLNAENRKNGLPEFPEVDDHEFRQRMDQIATLIAQSAEQLAMQQQQLTASLQHVGQLIVSSTRENKRAAQELQRTMRAPKRAIRDKDGRISGVEVVQ